jgi:hypothetical protein
MSDTQQEKEDPRQWFLRTGGETVFGPVPTQGLVVWAEQGRILPGHEVSTDRKKWVPAVSVELLDMRWYVDDGGGELRGPLNKLAAEALIKSGKVRENAQLVSADNVETPSGNDQAVKGSERSAHEPVPEDVLRVRVRELEALVSGQRERLAKLSNADAIETVQHDRDVLASLVKELEGQRDTILKNAEKDARANERKLEQMRQQVKRLEQQLEDTHSQLRLSEQTADGQAAAVAGTAAAAREEHELRVAGLTREADELKKRVAELEHAVSFHERRAEEAAQILSVREAELAAEQGRVGAAESARAQAEALAQAAERRAREADASFAELLDVANVRDTANLDKIAALEKTCAQSPEETARFFSDQAAVYELANAEVEELSKTLELERTHVEQLKEWSSQRQQALAERRQALLMQLGGSPADMTRRAVREQPADPNAARLRTEFDNLRVAHAREMRQAEDRERDLQRKLRVFESEAGTLRGLAVEGEKVGRRVQELSELLHKREQELAEERRNREAEREQFQGSLQTLLMRLDSLEKASRPATPDEIQAAEARNVKLATWMRLKK